MEMYFDLLNDLLWENGVSSIVPASNTQNKQQRLLIPMLTGQKCYALELTQDGEKKSWRVFEVDKLKYSAM